MKELEKEMENMYRDNWARFYLLAIGDAIVFFCSICMLNIGLFFLSIFLIIPIYFMYRRNIRVQE